DHADDREPRVRRAAGPRLRVARRHQGARGAGAAPSRRARTGRRDRGAHHRGGGPPDPRSGAGAPVAMRPTLRCLLVFLAGIPLSLGAVAIHPRLWTVWVAYLGAAVLLAGLDGVLALPRRRL